MSELLLLYLNHKHGNLFQTDTCYEVFVMKGVIVRYKPFCPKLALRKYF